jgi:transcriptional regulator with XRE-family HTH domain
MSQSELARRAGVDHTFISRLESGNRLPTRKIVVRLARELAGDDSEMTVRFLAAAGYAPVTVDPQADVARVWRLVALLCDHRLSEPARRLASSVIDGLVEALRAEIDRHIIRGNWSTTHTSEGGGE